MKKKLHIKPVAIYNTLGKDHYLKPQQVSIVYDYYLKQSVSESAAAAAIKEIIELENEREEELGRYCADGKLVSLDDEKM